MRVIEIPDAILEKVNAPEAGGKLMTQAVRRAQLLRLALRGVNAKKAAEVIGCSHATARAVYADPEFRKGCLGRLDDAFADIDASFATRKRSLIERMEEKAEVAFETLVGLLEAHDTKDVYKIKIAQDFLDRNPTTQAGHVVRTGPLADPDKLSQAARVAREMDNVLIMEKRA
jgi:hypothetical protein